MPARVLLLSRSLGEGGTERQLAELARSFDPQRFTPHVGCTRGDGFRAEELRRRGIPILELPMSSLMSRQALEAMMRLRQYVGANGIELVHAFDAPMVVFGVPAARSSAARVVLSSQRCFEDTIYPSHRKYVRIAHRLAHGIVANCEAVRKHLLDCYGVPAEKIRVCYNGLDTNIFRLGRRERAPALRDAKLVIGVVCVLRPEKEISLLLEAFAAVRDATPGMMLVIVGSGPEEMKLRQMSKDLGIAGQCLFREATRDVTMWLEAMDIFVLPSRSEALSNSLMEAMACGCCAMASRVGGNPELVDEGKTGLLFELGDARGLAGQLRRLIEQPQLRLAMAAAGAEKLSRHFSIEASSNRMQQIYDEFLRKKAWG
jgi:glycosyltransferase involved in cell wall biosynthesis